MNNVTLIGRLTKDPDLKTTQSGLSVCRFTVAVDRPYSKEKQTDFINCLAWRQTADFICKYFTKGQRIALIGSIQTGSYEKDGSKVYTTEVNVSNVEFCESKKQSGETVNAAETTEDIPLVDDDLPF
ncbi:MAG: single-stranded DNA-binding protein [Clostridia bacterium]|nr:single-stranded DNA-binding protein [Clostridia bacterium]